jgi:hypothetical protein
VAAPPLFGRRRTENEEELRRSAAVTRCGGDIDREGGREDVPEHQRLTRKPMVGSTRPGKVGDAGVVDGERRTEVGDRADDSGHPRTIPPSLSEGGGGRRWLLSAPMGGGGGGASLCSDGARAVAVAVAVRSGSRGKKGRGRRI